MIRSSLTDIKKVIKKNYPKPFDVSSYIDNDKSHPETIIVIRDFNQQIAQFQYSKTDGAILSGYSNNPKYRQKYEENFPEYYDQKHFDIYQTVFDSFYNNPILKEIVTDHFIYFTVNKEMFTFDEDYHRRLGLNNYFSPLNDYGFDISISFQYYVNENLELKPRMKMQFILKDYGSLIIWYDHSTEQLRFGEAQFIHGYYFLKFDATINKQMFGFDSGDSLNNLADLDQLINNWMIEMGVSLNKEAQSVYNMGDTFEPDIKEKVLDNFKLIKMLLF